MLIHQYMGPILTPAEGFVLGEEIFTIAGADLQVRFLCDKMTKIRFEQEESI